MWVAETFTFGLGLNFYFLTPRSMSDRNRIHTELFSELFWDFFYFPIICYQETDFTFTKWNPTLKIKSTLF